MSWRVEQTRVIIAGLSVALALSGCPKRQEAVRPDTGGSEAGGAGEQAATGGEDESAETPADLRFQKALDVYRNSKAADDDSANKALKLFNKVAEEDPTNGLARLNAGVIMERRGDAERAEELYRAALKADPRVEQAAENLALMYLQRGQKPKAVRLLEGSIATFPRAVGPRLRLARLALADKSYSEASGLAREALALDAKSLEAYRIMVEVALKQERPAMAKLLILKGYKIDKDDPYLHYLMAETLRAEGEDTAAVLEYRSVAAQHPDFLPARVRLGMLALEQRDFHSAEAHFAHIVKMEPSNYAALVNLGLAQKGQARFEDARKTYERALAVDPKGTEAMFALGVLELRHLNRPDEAKTYLQKFMKTRTKLPGKHAVFGLLEEANILIKSQEEEARQLELMQKQQQEMERKAAEQKQEPAEGQPGQPGSEGQPEGEPAPEQAESGESAGVS